MKEELNIQKTEGILASMTRFRMRYDQEQRLKNRKTENRTPPPLGREKFLEI